ncbi:hypothetical protein [Ideonella sp.]|jgi:hypothetical protein|uniref:hypothetical protein n=1 Tax=Ideonella sp. TaxID=1929293 RepID=UPI0037C089EC
MGAPDFPLQSSSPAAPSVPLMNREAFAHAIGLPVGVLVAQAERGYWPQITIGKRVFINVEAIRLKAAERTQEFAL